MITNEGIHTPSVAVAAPGSTGNVITDIRCAVNSYRPGVDSAIAIMSRNSFLSIHFFFAINSFSSKATSHSRRRT